MYDLPEFMYHGGAWADHGGGLNGLKPAHTEESGASSSYGPFPNVVNLTDREDALDWLYTATRDLATPGILYKVAMRKLDPALVRPTDLDIADLPQDPAAWTKEMIQQAVLRSLQSSNTLSYAGPIRDELAAVLKVSLIDDDEIIEQFRPFSQDHIAAAMGD